MKNNAEMGLYSRKLKVIVFVLLTLFVVLWLTPIVWGILCSFKPETEIKTGGFGFIPKTWTTEHYVEILTNTANTPILRWFLNSFIISGTTAILAVFLVAMTAYGYSRINFKYRDVAFITLMAFSLFPSAINIVPLYKVVSWFGWINKFPSIIVPALGGIGHVFMVRQFSMSIPKGFDEAASIDGANEFVNFFLIIMPMLKPVLTVVLLFTFTSTWNDYLWPSIIINDVERLPLTSGLKLLTSAYNSFNLGPVLAGASLAMIPAFLLYLFAQKYFLESLSLSSGIKE